jgi:HSP20 family protein
MSMRDLIPWNRSSRVPVQRGEEGMLFPTLHREMNRLFDDVFRGLDLSPFRVDRMLDRTWSWPSIEASENDKEVRVTAELPGLEEKDVEVQLSDGVLTIKGEKREEREEKEKNYHLSERRFGSFQRSFQLPAGVNRDKLAAEFEKGVLKITLPKSAEAMESQKKIPVASK